jgi:CRP/FNR family cyclic AMP-dependent transcriptional regulator
MGAHLQAPRSQIRSPRAAIALAPAGRAAVTPAAGIHAAECEFDVHQFMLRSGEAIITKFRKSECIFAQGDPADFVLYLREGTAKIMVVSEKGKEATIDVLRAGDFCGEGCLIAEPVRLLTAIAMSPATILRIPKKAFHRLLRDHPDFSTTFTNFLVKRSHRIQQELINQRFHSSEFRLAHLLINLSTNSGGNVGQRVLTRISQETLASMVGTTRSRISFFLNKFKKAGLIEYEGGIRINPALEKTYLR